MSIFPLDLATDLVLENSLLW